MSNNNEQKTDWQVILFLLIGLPTGFALGGALGLILAFVVGVVMLGWSKRHDGPFPTNKN